MPTATARATARTPRSTAVRLRSASRPSPRPLELRDAFPDARMLVLGPAAPRRGRDRPRRAPRAGGRRRSDPGGCRGAPEARHRHGTLGAVGAAGADPRGGRPDDASRDRRLGSRLRPSAARALPRGDRPPLAPRPPRGQQCGDALRLPESRFDAVRCGIALYGLSPFGGDAAADGLEPVLSWRSEIAQTKLLRAGESTGYGRRFVAERDTWIGIVPVGYGDGFRRDLTGTEVVVDGERRSSVRRHRVDGRDRRRARP